MKYVVLGLLLWFTTLMPGSAQSADEGVYYIVALTEGVKQLMKDSSTWITCGNYFAAAETTAGKKVLFNIRLVL